MTPRRVIVIGGGPAGFFAAITCAEAAPEAEVILLEKGSRFLDKVRISGGGRCNVTHACFDPRVLPTHYPRGESALRAPFQRFQARDAVEWFESRGVRLKTESDGRMFPTTDTSQTVMDCLLGTARRCGVDLRLNAPVEVVTALHGGGFEVRLQRSGSDQNPLATAGGTIGCDCVLLATGGCRSDAAGRLAVSIGHTLEPPVPSLFTFHIDLRWLRELAGISVETVEASVPGESLRERGALLITHWGLSGPAILRLSAWGARALYERTYQFLLRVNWLPRLDVGKISAELDSRRKNQPARLVVNATLTPLPVRLWEQLALAAGIARDTRWAALSRAAQHRLVQQLTRTEFQVSGKSLNKEEFVTCGGVRLNEVNFKTMESRLCAGLYFAGELLDVDGITGGFNFQAAWTTGWIAGKAMAQ